MTKRKTSTVPTHAVDLAGSSSEQAGEFNRALILQAIHRNAPISRADLARRTGLTKPGIAQIVDRLLDEGLIMEARRRRLQQVGYRGDGWWRHVLPGLGLLDWKNFFGGPARPDTTEPSRLSTRDAEFGWPGKSLEARKEGERRALNYLQRTISSLATELA